MYSSAAASMRESFGFDGQPGSYTDIDITDCLSIVGHHPSVIQAVLWSRILDRLEAPDLPKHRCRSSIVRYREADDCSFGSLKMEQIWQY